jgi:molecular chaperone DnaJ
VKREVPVQVAQACEECEGSGVAPGTTTTTCDECGGSGRIEHVSRTSLGEFVRSQACARCRGAGRIVEHPCSRCDGAGRVLEEQTLEVEIPAGIHDGQRIRLSGEGHAGPVGGESGDLYVLVRIRPHERLVREGDHVFSTVDLTMTQAALGARVGVPTLEGEVELEFEPGTQPGEVRVLRGQGMPVLQGFGRGDHRVLVNVAVPRQLTEEQRNLLGEFERTASEKTYHSDEGFFEKLKSAFR